MLRQRRKRLLVAPRLPPKVTPKAAPSKATQNERQFQGPVTAPTAPTARTAPAARTAPTAQTAQTVAPTTTQQPNWNPGNARTMPPPPTITAFRPPIRTRPRMAGPMMANTSESTRIPSEDRVERWTNDSELRQPSPVKQSRANRATFMFAALLLIIVAVSYIVRKRNRSALYGGYGGYGGGDGGFATW